MGSSSIGTVRFLQEPGHPSTMTPEQMWALRQLHDEAPGLTESHEQADVAWRRISELVPAQNKQQITLRLDADVVEFFRSTGRRYQSRINAALREYMTAQKTAV